MRREDLSLSMEFFPPQTAEGVAKLRVTRAQLAKLSPDCLSCTFGAGGSTRDRTLETVREIQGEGHAAARVANTHVFDGGLNRCSLPRFKLVDAIDFRKVLVAGRKVPEQVADRFQPEIFKAAHIRGLRPECLIQRCFKCQSPHLADSIA